MDKILQKIITAISPQELAVFLKSVRNDLSPADFDSLIEMVSGMQPGGNGAGSVEPNSEESKQGQQENQGQQPTPQDVSTIIVQLIDEGQDLKVIVDKLKKNKVPERIIQEALLITKQTIEQRRSQKGGDQNQYQQQNQNQQRDGYNKQ